ncbi:MAG: alpha/beta hydrolase [Deltaproteobacteria bacterium]|nr:alpha/beta hydrolase [Kofleriaceae bacterium]
MPVVFLHGGGQTRHAWGGTAAAVARSGAYAISLDHRGHGDSGWPADGNYDLAFAEDVRAIARQLGRPPVVVGASLGGLAALMAEGELGPLLRALVLVDVAPRLEQDGVARIINFMATGLDGFASLEDAADAIAAYLPNRKRPRDLGGLAKNLRQRDDGRWHWHWDPRFIRRDRGDPTFAVERMEAAARRVQAPTLVVRGRMSDVLTEDGVRALRALIPHAEYVDVAGAAHMVAGDDNDAFTSSVIGFLGRLDRALATGPERVA